MKGQVKNAVTLHKQEEAAKNAPRILERATIRQVEAMKLHRRAGLKEQEIADLMGISLASVSRHTRGVKPDSPDSVAPRERPAFSKVVSEPNGGEPPFTEVTKPSIIQIGVELDPELMLMLAGTASVQGYTSLKDYLKGFALPWLRAMKETQTLLSAETPDQYIAKLNEIVKGYVTYQRMLDQAQKEVGKDVNKSDGQQTSGREKN